MIFSMSHCQIEPPYDPVISPLYEIGFLVGDEHKKAISAAIDEIYRMRKAANEIIKSASEASEKYFTPELNCDHKDYHHESFCNGMSHGIDLIVERIKNEVKP